MSDINTLIRAVILKKLRRRGKWGGSHTSIDNLKKGLPLQYRGFVKDIAEEMIKEQLLLSKPTSYGLEVFLNPKRKADIDKIIKEVLKED